MNELLLAHLVALSLVVIDIAIRAWRIRLLVPGETVPTFWQTVTLNAYGEAASAVTPARLGGDPARFLGFRRSGVGTPAAIVALGAERAIDWVIILAASVGLAVTQGGQGVGGGAVRERGGLRKECGVGLESSKRVAWGPAHAAEHGGSWAVG